VVVGRLEPCGRRPVNERWLLGRAAAAKLRGLYISYLRPVVTGGLPAESLPNLSRKGTVVGRKEGADDGGPAGRVL
jgi:hypothetical protein